MVSLETIPEAGPVFKKFRKQHPREYEACFVRLDRLVRMMNQGVTVQQAMHSGFFNSEGEDIYRVGQERKGLKESRLYLHLQIQGDVIRVLRIGLKDEQQKDVNWCHDWVRRFRDGQNADAS